MFWTHADGGGQPQPLLTPGKNGQRPASFTFDGKRLAYTEGGQIWTVPVEENGGELRAGKPELFLRDQFNAAEPTFSPDGHWNCRSQERIEERISAMPPSPAWRCPPL
jgi:Tol biopolymer transport system component